jgi:hypothetical protein
MNIFAQPLTSAVTRQTVAEGLRQAREVVVIGFSMPGRDAAAIAAL